MGQCLTIVEMMDKTFCKDIDVVNNNNLNQTSAKIIQGPGFDYEPDSRGLGWELFNCMLKFQQNVAQICVATEKEETYKTLLDKTIRTAIRLKEKNIRPKDIILVYSYNHVDSSVPWLASLFIGSTIAYVDPLISLNDTVHLIKQVKNNLKIVFVTKEHESLIEDALNAANATVEIVVFDNRQTNNSHSGKNIRFKDDFINVKRELEEVQEFRPYSWSSVKDTCVIFFSSGTTGLPKGICINHYALACQAYNICHCGFDVRIIMSYASLYWISTAVTLVGVTFKGGTRLLIHGFDPVSTWKYIDRYRPTLLFLAPVQAVFMLKVGRPEGVVTTSIREVIVGGGHLTSNYLNAIRDLLPGAGVSLAYGQTEVAGTLTVFSPKYRLEVVFSYQKPSSCGRASPGIQFKVVDSETDELLGPNKKGELRVKTDFVMNGYYQLDSSSSFDSEGWLKTGDMVYYDEDDCFYVVDRLKELLKYQGYHVTPSAIELVLNEHSAVKLGVVIGVPHEVDGDHAMAVVMLSENSKNVTSDTILGYVNSKLDNIHQLRGGVKIVTAIPMTATGKVKRKELKDMILQGRI